MKGRISIADFIHQVKAELLEAEDKTGDPLYSLGEVTLEISFTLDAKAKAGVELYVMELGADVKAEQVHKVSMKFLPLRAQTFP